LIVFMGGITKLKKSIKRLNLRLSSQLIEIP
jgi:hypothetical protein